MILPNIRDPADLQDCFDHRRCSISNRIQQPPPPPPGLPGQQKRRRMKFSCLFLFATVAVVQSNTELLEGNQQTNSNSNAFQMIQEKSQGILDLLFDIVLLCTEEPLSNSTTFDFLFQDRLVHDLMERMKQLSIIAKEEDRAWEQIKHLSKTQRRVAIVMKLAEKAFANREE